MSTKTTTGEVSQEALGGPSGKKYVHQMPLPGGLVADDGYILRQAG